MLAPNSMEVDAVAATAVADATQHTSPMTLDEGHNSMASIVPPDVSPTSAVAPLPSPQSPQSPQSPSLPRAFQRHLQLDEDEPDTEHTEMTNHTDDKVTDATVSSVAPPLPPLTPIKERKRPPLHSSEEEADMIDREPKEASLAPPVEREMTAASLSVSCASPVECAAMPLPIAAHTAAAVASSSSRPRSSPTAWPWYLVTEVSGAANAAYADFVPTNPSPNAELPDVDATDWWGIGGGGGAADSKKDDGEMKSTTADEKGAECKPARPSPRVLTIGDPDDSRAFNLIGHMGQDAYFGVSNASIGCAVVGVADGVGGWRDNGIDSGEISRALMKSARSIAVSTCAEAAAGHTTDRFTLRPSDILTAAYLDVKEHSGVEAGSTTACIVALTPMPVTTPSSGHMNVSTAPPPPFTAPATSPLSPNSIAAFLTTSDAMSDVMAAVIDVNRNLTISSLKADDESKEVRSSSKPIDIPAAADKASEPSPTSTVGSSATTSDDDALPSDSEHVYLSAANLGDSGYMLLRRDDAGVYRVVHMSDLQRIGGTVKQLAIIPPRFQHDSYCDDSPSDAELDAHLVKEDDLLILASDGLWDNLIDGEWASSLRLYSWRRTQADLERAAQTRKARMIASVESIAAECALIMQNHRALSLSTSPMQSPPAAQTTSEPASEGATVDIAASDPMTDHLARHSTLTVPVAVAPPPSPIDWDAYEVRLFADQLQSFAQTFMPKPEGKPDDLTILCSKVKRRDANQ